MTRRAFKVGRRGLVMAGLLALCLGLALPGCSTSGSQPAPSAPQTEPVTPFSTSTPEPTQTQASPTPRPSRTATQPPAKTLLLSPSPTATLWIPPTRVHSFETFRITPDPNATPYRYPIRQSVSMPIWGEALPASTIVAEPQFIIHPPPGPFTDPNRFVIQAGCSVDRWSYAECPAGSPLNQLGCDQIVAPDQFFFRSTPDLALIASCWKDTTNHIEPKEGYLYRVGCAFPVDVGYIFLIQGEYVHVDTVDGLKELLLPVKNAEEALSYAQLVTGLDAYQTFTYDESLMYFQEEIESTHVNEDAGSYSVNLYHAQTCLCEPWLTTEVQLEVDREGNLTWKEAIPVFMTTGFGCAD